MSDATFSPSRRILLLGAGALTLSACSGVIGPAGENQIYLLRPTFQKIPGPSVTWGMSIDRPDADQSLDTNRISITRSPTTMDYYANAVWTDRITDLVRDNTVRAFEESGRQSSIAAASVGARAEYSLEMQVRHFEARYDTPDGAPTAVVELHVKLVRKLKQNIMGDFVVHKEAQASANSIDAAVMAFDQAFSAALVELVEWTLRTGVPIPA
jgi:cholesterol transport system auxiliary component